MKTICVTNRILCKNDFFKQIELICKENIYALILREKDLDNKTYEKFAIKCNSICKQYNVLFFINTKTNVAQKLQIKNIQISFKDFLDNNKILSSFKNIAVSVHSKKEAIEVNNIAKQETYKTKNIFIIAGHIFETKSKQGLKPKGTDFLKDICDSVDIDVFAIGGISKQNINQLQNINIKGICLMSTAMQANNKKDFLF